MLLLLYGKTKRNGADIGSMRRLLTNNLRNWGGSAVVAQNEITTTKRRRSWVIEITEEQFSESRPHVVMVETPSSSDLLVDSIIRESLLITEAKSLIEKDSTAVLAALETRRFCHQTL